MSELRWRKIGNHPVVFSGSVSVGHAVYAPADRLYHWKLDGVFTRLICKNYGTRKTEASAKRSVQQAWNKWCHAAGLVAKSGEGDPA